ncbi:MAG: type II toxin-antitoxin system VapC family toxin [Burkholderiaceae bacterium]|nr:type II toxin-antitoxin system VapC family toxin [Burkholderiaceae bacterium]MCD6672220.1 type II toxin-antitoxin system VapC family toxin [Burkholderiaceae bacterium]
MPALDTNVLVRFLVRDDGAQAAAATELVRRAAAAGEALFVPITVALELEWVLRSNYELAKTDIARTFCSLLSTDELSFESEAALEYALLLWQERRADFSDCVHVALAAHAGEQPLWTFDRKASALPGADMLK